MECEHSARFAAALDFVKSDYGRTVSADFDWVKLRWSAEHAGRYLEKTAAAVAARLVPDISGATAMLASDPWLMEVRVEHPPYGREDRPLWIRVREAVSSTICRALADLPGRTEAEDFRDYGMADVALAGGRIDKALAAMSRATPDAGTRCHLDEARSGWAAAVAGGDADRMDEALKSTLNATWSWKCDPGDPMETLRDGAIAFGFEALEWIARARVRDPGLFAPAPAPGPRR